MLLSFTTCIKSIRLGNQWAQPSSLSNDEAGVAQIYFLLFMPGRVVKEQVGVEIKMGDRHY